jgi:hypothetical protein
MPIFGSAGGGSLSIRPASGRKQHSGAGNASIFGVAGRSRAGYSQGPHNERRDN